jgi:lipopolysaccharide biosynthesis protein
LSAHRFEGYLPPSEAAEEVPGSPGGKELRRVIFYLFYDALGIVDAYVPHKLKALREFAEHIFVVSNSKLTVEGRRALDEVADTVWARENVGFDVWAYKEAMATFGMDRLAEYDELILMNYTFFAPIFPFAETFDAMDARDDLDFWGLTAHKAIDPNPWPDTVGILPLHIQSHWIAVRKTMFTSIEWAWYWEKMPPITSYTGSIMQHEARFTQHFSDRGFQFTVAFDPDRYPSDHPMFESVVLMLEDRCPILKRRIFFHEPTYLERNAILGKRVMDLVAKTDYPIDLIWRNVVRSAEPRTLYTNMSMLSVIPDIDLGERPDPPLRICVLAHIYYEEMTDEMMGWIGQIPVPYDLVVTTTNESKKCVIEKALAGYGLQSVQVRVVESNRGRAESAFIIACRDVLTSGDYDLILKVHSKKSPQNGHNIAHLFKHHSVDNLLSSPGYVAGILGMFEKQPSLGMVFPPVVHIGFPTLGHSWFTNREVAHELANKLGIHTVFDRSTPLAAYGGMFWARPEALAKLAEHRFEYRDFAGDDEGYGDGMLGHVLERLYSYTVLDSGHTVQSVLNTDWAAINYAFLEYKLQRISAMLPAYTQEQVDYISLARAALEAPPVVSPQVSPEVIPAPPLAHLKDAVDRSYPRLGRVLRPLYRAVRAIFRAGQRVTGK